MPVLMKGQKWRDAVKKGSLRFEFPVRAEEKRDEIRARFFFQGATAKVESYAQKPLYNLEHITEVVGNAMIRGGISELDAGIEVNGNFNDTYRLTRSKNGPPAEHMEIVVWVFDLPDYDYYPQWKRSIMLSSFCASASIPWLKPIPGREVHTMQELMQYYEQVRSDGIEGLMVKVLDGLYERKRSWNWYKLKPEDTHDGKIIGLHEAVCGKDQPELGLSKGDMLGRIGSVTVRLEDGTTATPHGIPFALGEEMLNNPTYYLDRWVEFTCMERDRQGGYRHPIFKRIREDKA